MSHTSTNRLPHVPFLDLKTPHRRLREEILQVWGELLDEAAFIGGAQIEEFEGDFAAYCGADDCVGVGSGTDALRLTLQAMGLRPGDEVITVAHTFIATIEAITQAGGRPVLVDVDEATGTMDVSMVEAAITRRTRVLLPVHLYGQAADMGPLLEIARRRGLRLLEDAAQAHGGRYEGRPVGSLGDAAAFSFYPGKNLGACGEAGAVTTSDPEIAARIRVLRDHGQERKYLHIVEGTNARLDALQAAALRIKLHYLDEWNEARRGVAARYDEGLAGLPVVVPAAAPGRTHVYHLYVIRHPRRDALRETLAAGGVHSGMHYPVPVHLQPAYAWLELTRGRFPHSERWADEGLSLPMFPEMTREQVNRVCDLLAQATG